MNAITGTQKVNEEYLERILLQQINKIMYNMAQEQHMDSLRIEH